MRRGKLALVGFGPGAPDQMTFRAREAILAADVIVGYKTYVDLIRPLCAGKAVESTGMTDEVPRAQRAVALAEAGQSVAVVCSGDAGVYGMAGLVLEVLRERGWQRESGIAIEVVPGVTAANAAAALMGAPLMHDWASISLSDLLTPRELILRRVEAALAADFVIALYNPASMKRRELLAICREMALRHRPGSTPVAVVQSAYRPEQSLTLTDLDHLLDCELGMLATVIIGNSQTTTYQGLMITPRGYGLKYGLEGDGLHRVVRPGQRPGHALVTQPTKEGSR